jgi:hypothetical protein
MRSLSLLTLAALLTTAGGCKPSTNEPPEWTKLPAAYQPATAELTFNRTGLERFNAMSQDERDAFVNDLMTKKGAFKGQALLVAGTGISDRLPEYQHGDFELVAKTDEVLYEITIDYSIYTTAAMGKTIPRSRPIEFTGTVIGLEFQDADKPRKLKIQVKADNVTQVQ